MIERGSSITLIGKWLLDEKKLVNIAWKAFDEKPITLAKLIYANGTEVPLLSPLVTKNCRICSNDIERSG